MAAVGLTRLHLAGADVAGPILSCVLDDLASMSKAARLTDLVSYFFAPHARSGANISATDPLGRTPLHLAAMLGHALTAGRLVIAGAAVARQDGDGYTPGHYAAMYGNAEVRQAQGEAVLRRRGFTGCSHCGPNC